MSPKKFDRCPMCDEWYDPNGERAKMHEHPEPQSGPSRAAWLASGLSYEEWNKLNPDWATRKSE